MKKALAKTLAAAVALALILPVLAVPAFAASERYDFGNCGGYQCVGYASLYSGSASASFSATAIPYEPIIMEDLCRCTVTVTSRDSRDKVISSSTESGTISTAADIVVSTYDHVEYSYTFNGTSFGTKTLYNP